jgi:HEAT repeat protein
MGLIKIPHDHDDTEKRAHSRDYAGLVTQLSETDPAARRWAARDLLQHPHSTPELVARLECEEDASVREVILTSLTRLGDECAVAALVALLRSQEARFRNEAIEAMQSLPDKVAPIIGDLLSDTDPDVRIMAVNVLESLRHPDVETWLIEVIDRDTTVNVCATAVDLLGEIGTEAAVDALRRLKVRFADEPYIQFASDLALKRVLAS